MKLTKRHRIALMNQLSLCNESIELSKEIIKKNSNKVTELSTDKEIDDIKDIISSFEIRQFIMENQKALVEESIFNNEINF